MRFRRSRPQFVHAKVQVVQAPSPERQLIDTKKWTWTILVTLDQFLPTIPPERFDALNRLLLLAETDRVLFGVTFVEIRTDTPERYDAYDIATAVCECFGFRVGWLNKVTPEADQA